MSEASTAVARAVVRKLAGRIRHGTLVVREGPTEWRAGCGEPVAHATVHDPRAYTALLARGARGFGRSYVDGWWDADDPTTLVRLLLRNLEGFMRVTDSLGRLVSTVADPLDRRRDRRVDPTVHRATDQRNIRAHYDLSNEFFEFMLDETMSYSCALFEHAGATLAEASRAKLDRICTKLHLGPADHVLEIGTGWGSFALHAASRYGCRVTTTTISDAQFEHASKRVVDANLADLVDVRGDDYRDLTGTFDKLVSIEMIEAVGWRQFDTFFSRCNRLLRPDGLMMLQAIVIDDRSYERSKRRTDFIKESVFPGGCLPSLAAIVASAARLTDLSVIDMSDIGAHYPETLRRWRANLIRHAEEIESPETGTALIDHACLRLFHLYLCYCEAAFLERHISDVQLVFAGRGWRP
jgi:cyclopropane-fatty-acyl-phospholipid synthase